MRTEATLVDSSYRRFVAQASNISQTGIALECLAPLIARQIVQLEFTLPGDQDKLSCKAQIIWMAGNGKTGLTFTDMSSSHRERLTEWIESQFLRKMHPATPVTTSARLTHAIV
ncbi:MAG: hypothetical protein DMG61_21345 [Acidobacteria bacterium]|nr:MAG: hypothetical protein DMG61_21345 [Acidobacteriota bacterium]PYY16790.1 MAG: hypothetical protein DMG60_13930 [Acidobacteriota bacterium]